MFSFSCLFRRSLVAALLIAPSGPAAALKVASTDLCADQIAVLLLSPDEIAGLSRWARTPAISAIADQAQNLPILAPSAEAVLTSGADLVLAGEYGDRATERLLERLGVPVIRIKAANDFAQMEEILLQAGRDLGREEQARRLVQDFSIRLSATPQRQDHPAALYLRPDGGSAGSGTPIDAALQKAGFRNQAALLGLSGWGAFKLEHLVMSPPDLWVASFFENPERTRSGGFGRHPVLRKALKEAPTLSIPGALWSCGGWPLVEAVEKLAEGGR